MDASSQSMQRLVDGSVVQVGPDARAPQFVLMAPDGVPVGAPGPAPTTTQPLITRSKKRVKGGTLRQRKDGQWVYDHRDGRGRRVREVVGADRGTAEARAKEISETAWRIKHGLLDASHAERLRPLEVHLKEFEEWLRSGNKRKSDRADLVMAHLREFVASSGARMIDDITLISATRWLSPLEARADTARFGQQGLSARTLNSRRASLRQFVRWLINLGRLSKDPLTLLDKFDESRDKRLKRRALTDEELGRLLAVALERPLTAATAPRPVRSRLVTPVVSPAEMERLRAVGEARVIVYVLAYRCGMRRKEIERLRWGQIDFDGGFAKYEVMENKSRRVVTIPFTEPVLNLLRQWRDRQVAVDGQDLVFKRLVPTIKTLREDLVASGIAPVDDDGRRVDLHGGRRTLREAAKAAKIDLKDQQAILRHAQPDTLLKHYSDEPAVQHLRAELARIAIPLPAGLTGTTERVQSVPEGPEGEGPDKDLRGVEATPADAARDGASSSPNSESPVVSDGAPRYARRDSNAQPLAPEANALSN